uniref:Gag1-like clamp domain-containing protein n=1 Tax=Chenopodium quinoa TaxID=63459 RepID=A0A803LHA1_CHEQI
MTVYDSFTSWINSFLACIGSCLGGCAKPTHTPVDDYPTKGLQCQGQVVEKQNLSDDFWGTSTGLLLWTQIRLQWIGATKSNEDHQTIGPAISLNATYDSLLSSRERFRRPIPLSEMVDFLVDVWEQEGLYD